MRNSRLRPFLLLLAVLLLALSLQSVFAQPRADTFIVAQGLDPRSLSPLSSTAQQEKNVSNQIVERLINFTPSGDGFVPVLATSWESVDDKTIRLNLRQGVSFTNGEPFNAEAAKYSLEQMLAAEPYASFVQVFDHFLVVDEYTVDAVSAGPAPTGLMLNALAMGSFMYPPVYAEESGVMTGFGNAPIGTGPYVFDRWVKDDTITLRANANYWAGRPGVEYLQFRSIPEAAVRVAALEAGDIDFSIDVPLDAVARLERNRDLQVVSAVGGRVYGLTLRLLEESDPLQDKSVREAIRMAIDTDSIIDFVLGGQAERVTQMVSSTTFGYNPDLPLVEFDQEGARAKLAEAGVGGTVSVQLEYTAGRFPMDREIGELIAAQLSEVGIDVRQNVLESGDFLNRLLGLRLHDLYYSGSLTPPDANFQYVSYTCGFVYSYYCNQEFHDIFYAATTMVDDDERQAAYQRLAEILYEDVHVVPLYTMNDIYAHRSGLTGWEPMRDQFLDFSAISFD